MKIRYQITDTGAEALRVAIVQDAVNIHQKAIKKRIRYGHPDEDLSSRIRKIEAFFLSAWGQSLCSGKGEYIIEKDYAIVREELAKEKRR